MIINKYMRSVDQKSRMTQEKNIEKQNSNRKNINPSSPPPRHPIVKAKNRHLHRNQTLRVGVVAGTMANGWSTRKRYLAKDLNRCDAAQRCQSQTRGKGKELPD